MINQDVFKGRQFVLDLPTNTSYTEKLALKKKITTHSGIVSYIITRKTNFVVRATSDTSQSYRMQIADKYGVQVVTPDFLDACLDNGMLVDSNLYLAHTKHKRQQNHFSEGKIFAKSEIKSQPARSRLLSIKTWAYKDNKGPTFHNFPYIVVKAVVLKGKQKERGYHFCIIEIHLTHGHYLEEQYNRFCVFTHQGVFSSFSNINECCKKTCRFVKSSSDALHIFEQLYKLYSNPPHSMVHCNSFPNHPNLGSDHFHVEDWLLAPILVQPKVAQFVTDVWAEVLYMLESTLSVPLKSIQEMQVIQGEASLLEISNALLDGDINKADEFSKEFFKAVPHQCQDSIKTWDMLISKHDLCQLIGDMLMLQELVSISDENTTEQQYFSLHCDIQVLKLRSWKYQAITSLILDKNEDLKLTVSNIFTVRRSCEDDDFTYDIGNKRLLFHGSKIENFVGILSRGMLPSKPIGCQDTNMDNNKVLGSGLYFTDEITAAVQYAVPSHTSGRRYLLISEVALGECCNLYSYKAQLVLPPGGYNSICGVKHSEPEVASDFEYNQYVVYQVSQQRLRYIVEFCLPGDPPMMEKYQSSVNPNILQVNPLTFFTRADFNVSTFDVEEFLLKHDHEIVPAEVGLCSDAYAVPLKSLHIRAKLIDLAAEVVVLQEYYNDSSSSIEARYVFPLDSKAAVCGFEAFSNGQHFIGRIEEKKEAHQEYKQAVESGQRAYLLDEEAPDVFKVSVGNVPPHSTVLVKIRYVAELDLEGDLISFRLPGSLCPWQHQQVLDSQSCTGDQSVNIPNSQNISTTLQLFVEMPFDIKSLFSPTHSIEVKKTLSKAVVSTDIVTNRATRFQLLIGLSEIHVPRMWVEKHPDMDSTACMLTFYPEFVTDAKDSVEVILALDASNSMCGTSFAAAKQVAILCLHYLPPEAKFNVLMFGTTYYEIFPTPQKKSLENVHDAQKSILESKPSFGSSRIDHFLQSYFNLIPHKGTLRNIFVITDGHLQHVDRVLSMAEKQNSHTRLFTLGVGPFVNSHLLNRISHAGGGTYQCFDDNRQSQWVAKLKDQMLKVEEPVLTDVRVEWQQFNADDSVLQAPQQLNSVFSGSRLTVYGFVSNCSLATLKAFVMGTEITTTIFTSKLAESNGTILHGLTTKAIVRDWENGSFNEDRVLHEVQKRTLNTKIIELSKQFSIITPLTSYVSVENKDNNKIEGLSSCPTIGELVHDEDVDFLKYIQSHTEISHDTTAEELWELGAEESGYKMYNKVGNEKHEYLLKNNQHPSILNSGIQNRPTSNATKLFKTKDKSRKEIITHSGITSLRIKSKPTITESLEEVVEHEPENNSLTTTSNNLTTGNDRPQPVIGHKHLKPFLCSVEDSVEMETESSINFNVVSKTKNCDLSLQQQEVMDEHSTTSNNEKMHTATHFSTSSPEYIPTSPSYATSSSLPPVHPSTVFSTTSPEYIPTSPSYAPSSPLLPVHPSTVFSTTTPTFGFSSFSNSNPAASKPSSYMCSSTPAVMFRPMSLNSSTQQQQTQAQLPQHVPSNSIATNFSFGGTNLESDSKLMKTHLPMAKDHIAPLCTTMAKDHMAPLCTTPAFAPTTDSQVHHSNILSHSLFSNNKGTLGAFAAGNQAVSLQTSNSLFPGFGSSDNTGMDGFGFGTSTTQAPSSQTTASAPSAVKETYLVIGSTPSLIHSTQTATINSANAVMGGFGFGAGSAKAPSLQTGLFAPSAVKETFGFAATPSTIPTTQTAAVTSASAVVGGFAFGAGSTKAPSLQTGLFAPSAVKETFGFGAAPSLIASTQTSTVTSANVVVGGFSCGGGTTEAPLQKTASAPSAVKETYFGIGTTPSLIHSTQTDTVNSANAVVGGFGFGAGSTKAPLQTGLFAPSAVKETFGFGATPSLIPSTQRAAVNSANVVVGGFSFGADSTKAPSLQTGLFAPSAVKETFGFGAAPSLIPSTQTSTVTSANVVVGGFSFGGGTTEAPLQKTASAPSAVKETYFGIGTTPSLIHATQTATVNSTNAVVGGFGFGADSTKAPSLQTGLFAPSAVKETFGFGAKPSLIPSTQTSTVTSANVVVGGFSFSGGTTEAPLQKTASAPSAVKETYFGIGTTPSLIHSTQTANVNSANAVVSGFGFGAGSAKDPSLQTGLFAPSAVKETFGFAATPSTIPTTQTAAVTSASAVVGGFGFGAGSTKAPSLQTGLFAPSAVKETFGFGAAPSLIALTQTSTVTSANVVVGGFSCGGGTTEAPLQKTASAPSAVKETYFGIGTTPSLIHSTQTSTVNSANAVVGGFGFGAGLTKAPLQTGMFAPSAVKETFDFGATPSVVPSSQRATVNSANVVVGGFSFGAGSTKAPSLQTGLFAPSAVKETFGFGAAPSLIPSTQTSTVTSANVVVGGFSFGGGTTEAPLQKTASAPSAVKETYFGIGTTPSLIHSTQTATVNSANAVVGGFGFGAGSTKAPSLQTTLYAPGAVKETFGFGTKPSLIPSTQTSTVTSANVVVGGFSFSGGTTEAPLQKTASAPSAVKETYFGIGTTPSLIHSTQTANVNSANAVVGGFGFGAGSAKDPSLQTGLFVPSAVKETFGFAATPSTIPTTQTAAVTSASAVVGDFGFGAGSTKAPSAVKETFGFGAAPSLIASTQTSTVTSANVVVGGFSCGGGTTEAPLQKTASAPSAVKETYFGIGTTPSLIHSTQTATVNSANAVVGGFGFGAGSTKAPLQTGLFAPSAVKETFGFGATPSLIPSTQPATVTSASAVVGGFGFGASSTKGPSLQTKEVFGYSGNTSLIPSSQMATITSKSAVVGGFAIGPSTTQASLFQTTASAPSAVKETFGFGAKPYLIPSSETATITSKNTAVSGFTYGASRTQAQSLQTAAYVPNAIKKMFGFGANTSVIPSLQTGVDTPKDTGFGGFGSRINAPQVHSLQTTVHATNNAIVGFTPPSGFSELGCFRFPQESHSKSSFFGSAPSHSSIGKGTGLFGSTACGQRFVLQKPAHVPQFPVTEITATQDKPLGLPQQLQMGRSADVYTQKSAGDSVPGSTNSGFSFGSTSFQVPSVHSLVGSQKNPDVGTAPLSMLSEVGSFESQQLFQSKLTPNAFPPGYSIFGSNSAKLSCQTAAGVAQFPGSKLNATRAKLLGLPQQAIPGRSSNSYFQSSTSGSLFGSANCCSIDRNQSLFKMPVDVLQANSSPSEMPVPLNDSASSVSDTQQHNNPGGLLHLPSNAIKTLALSDSDKSESVSLGSGLPFFSAVFKRLVIADFAFMTPQQIGVKINELSKLTNPRVKESIFCALDYCNSRGAVRHNNLPSNWNHHLWHSIQGKLADNGLKSMGSLVHDVILDLIATIAVLFAVCRKLFPDIFPLNLNSPEGIVKQGNIMANILRVCISEKRLLSFILCLVYITTVNQRHPLVYRTLELGSSWEEAYFNLTSGALLLEI